MWPGQVPECAVINADPNLECCFSETKSKHTHTDTNFNTSWSANLDQCRLQGIPRQFGSFWHRDSALQYLGNIWKLYQDDIRRLHSMRRTRAMDCTIGWLLCHLAEICQWNLLSCLPAIHWRRCLDSNGWINALTYGWQSFKLGPQVRWWLMGWWLGCAVVDLATELGDHPRGIMEGADGSTNESTGESTGASLPQGLRIAAPGCLWSPAGAWCFTAGEFWGCWFRGFMTLQSISGGIFWTL